MSAPRMAAGAAAGSLRDRLIVALDMPDLAAATAQVDRLGEGVLWYKVGLQLFCSSGRGAVESIAARGKKIFLDLKLHDIPATVEKAIRALDGLPVSLLTVHAAGGPKMLEAAAAAARSLASRPAVVGVTVLTSLDGDELPGVWDPKTDLEAKVLALAKLCADAGVDGVVASPRELAALRRAHPAPFCIVTPGIRGPQDAAHDQRRTLSIGEAFALGADHIVVGRPLLEAADPRAVLASYADAADLPLSSERMKG